MLFDTPLIDFKDAQELRLIDRGLIKVSGQAAEKFLQGVLTCDVSVVKINLPSPLSTWGCLGAHCNAKGRIIFTFRLFYSSDHYFLSLPKNQVVCAMHALKKYAVFSKVSIENVSEEVSLVTLARFNPSLSFITDFEHWKLKDIEAGIAEIYSETREQFTPHELNYHQLNAVSFDKGCYIGQEIVARMHYLGKLKTKLLLADFVSETMPHRGEKIFYGDLVSPQLAGYLVDFASTNNHQYKLLVTLYMHAHGQTLWINAKVANHIHLRPTNCLNEPGFCKQQKPHNERENGGVLKNCRVQRVDE